MTLYICDLFLKITSSQTCLGPWGVSQTVQGRQSIKRQTSASWDLLTVKEKCRIMSVFSLNMLSYWRYYLLYRVQWAMFPDINIVFNNSAKQILFIKAIHQPPLEKCFSTLLYLLLSPLSLSDHNQVCKAWRFLLLPVSISHSTSPLLLLSLSLPGLSFSSDIKY